MNPKVKNILIKIGYLLSLPMIIGGYVFAHQESKKEVVSGYNVEVVNPQYSFILENDVLSFIDNHGIAKAESNIKSMNLSGLENEFNNMEWVHLSDWYVDASNKLHVRLTQTEPVVRVQNNDSLRSGMYLDSYANDFSLSSTYSAMVPIATTVNELGCNQEDMSIRKQLVELATYIQQDSFWNSTISQINIDEKNEFELIPAIGTQIIKFGSAEMKEDKLARLLSFYKKGINSLPWEKYQELDVRYKNQVICRNLQGEILSKDPYDELSKKIVKEQENASNNKNKPTAKQSMSSAKPKTSQLASKPKNLKPNSNVKDKKQTNKQKSINN